ncbi:hypothetical protein QTP86_009007 [Hemibagrus guttatus]|nr:hypothetical protein QTP86_009007 [Hemibagrus guttatus]
MVKEKNEMKKSITQMEENNDEMKKTITQMEEEKSDLTDQLKTLRETVEELGKMVLESNRECDERINECEREREARSILQSKYDEMIKTQIHVEELLKVTMAEAEEKHQKDVETINQLEKEKTDLIIEECEREQEAHRTLQSKYDEMIKTMINMIHKEELLKDPYVARTGVTGVPPWSQAWGWGMQASAWWPSLCLRHCPKGKTLGPPSHRPTTRMKEHKGLVQCVLGSSHGRGPRGPKPWTKKLAFGTWNVTSLGGKEPELVRGVEWYRLEIVGLASTHSPTP